MLRNCGGCHRRSPHYAIIGPFALVVMIFLTCCTAGAQRTNDEMRLRATVQNVVMLSHFSGTLTPVHVDPMFAMTVRIESATPAHGRFAEGSVITFGIHSPTTLFGGDPAKGKTYDFIVRRQTENGKVRYSGLEVRREQVTTRPTTTRSTS